jgi:hypothetical protein
MNVNYQVIQDRLFKRIHRTGEEIKNDFPNVLRAAIDTEAWKHFKTIDGKAFKNLGEWLTYSFPNGVSMGKEKTSISYEDALQLVANDRELHGLLVKHRPSNQGKRSDLVNNVNEVKEPERHKGNTRAYIEQRLQDQHPKVWKDYVEGRIKSARQAGIQAGFIKDTHDPLMRLKAYWNKADGEQRAAFKKWLRSDEANS